MAAGGISILSLLLVAAGGAVGSVARALATYFIPAGRLPWATLLVNIAGSLLIGWLMARFATFEAVQVRGHSFCVV
jgi:fluoride exporter